MMTVGTSREKEKLRKNGEKTTRGKRKRVLAITAGILAVSLSIVGCHTNKYEKIDLSEAEMSEDSDKEEDAERDTGDTDEGQTAGEGNEKEAQAGENTSGGEQEAPAAEKSAVKAEVTTETSPELEPRDETVRVIKDNARVRTSPDTSTDDNIEKELRIGERLHRTGVLGEDEDGGEDGEWSRVIYEGQERYVFSELLEKISMEQGAVAAAAAGDSESSGSAVSEGGEVGLNPEWKYADFAKISSGKAMLYRAEGDNRKGKVVCVNAGHGTSGGSSVKTQCHPDGTPKVTGGTTGAGATSAVAVSSGMTFDDGTPEPKVTVTLAKILKEKLLARGFDVLMIRESDDIQLDNVARTVIANNMAHCHVALHWDSTTSDKGAFYMSVPNISSYRAMEPVASHWQEHHALGDSLIAGLKGAGVKIFSDGKMDMDLTQTSFSTIPSVDIELGDKVSDHSQATLETLAQGLADGIEQFFAE